ncbi:hypothetical protein B0T14DRAFT_534019 [Immersiella caudata]|uniref:Uncharacterized protein n=1 Tax=Immersiella caudata TaxID=314043 RepID=A0AA39XHB4_9PEZI|nr:hypothetical protein B0T14DRAFT_534019 [Immersiella caudata]
MAASNSLSHFTVHVFINHHPALADALLPDLFLDFPDSSWKLDPLEKPAPRPLEKPGRFQDVNYGKDPRKVLGRYVFPEALTCNTTLLQLSEMMERQFDIARKHQAQFVIFPQETTPDGHYPLSERHPLPWNMTLAQVHPLDFDALIMESEHSEAYAPILQLVLETKAAALLRMVDTGFLGPSLGEPYSTLRDQWNRFDSFWHSGKGNQYSQLAPYLNQWRRAKSAHAYLTRERQRGRMGTENDEMKTLLGRVEEIRAIKRRGVYSKNGEEMNLGSELIEALQRIAQIESGEAEGREERMVLSWFVTQWEDWFSTGDFGNSETRILEPGEVESAVAAVIRHSHRLVGEWISSERMQQFKASVEDEYFAARPWLTAEDRAVKERSRVARMEQMVNDQFRRAATSGAPRVPTGDYLTKSLDIQVHDIRRSQGKLLQDQSTFTITSGSLLWGQIIPLYSTLSNPNFTQNANHMPPELPGGTIVQHRYTYRSAGRNGRWKIRAFHERERLDPDSGALLADPDAPEKQTGWILYHEDLDPVNTLGRVRWLDGSGPGAVSNKNLHTDRDVVYIGRYDWSHHTRSTLDAEFQEWAEPVIGAIPDNGGNPYERLSCNVQKGGYLIAVDEENFGLDFVDAYKRYCDRGFRDMCNRDYSEDNVERVFRKEGVNFGTFLSKAYTREDYGWLVFSGEQDAKHSVDELVAIVYSSWRMENAYLAPEGDPSP